MRYKHETCLKNIDRNEPIVLLRIYAIFFKYFFEMVCNNWRQI